MPDTTLMEQLTSPQPSARTILLFGIACALYQKQGIRALSGNTAHHAIAVAWKWGYLHYNGADHSQKTYSGLYNDLCAMITFISRGMINQNALIDYQNGLSAHALANVTSELSEVLGD